LYLYHYYSPFWAISPSGVHGRIEIRALDSGAKLKEERRRMASLLLAAVSIASYSITK